MLVPIILGAFVLLIGGVLYAAYRTYPPHVGLWDYEDDWMH